MTEDKKAGRRKWICYFALVAVGLTILVLYLVGATRSLDRIEAYEVTASPQENGELLITYHLRWRVLDSSSEGPLSWVKIGMANDSFTVVSYEGDIRAQRQWETGSYASFDLKKDFYEGETADFTFTVRQKRLLCRDSENAKGCFYRFTPGWFDQIDVRRYTFTWASVDGVTAHNADRVEDGRLIWEGKLKQGKRREMEIAYSRESFRNPLLVTWAPSGMSGGEGSRVNAGVVLMILFLTGLLPYCLVFGRRGYRGGRYFYHGGGYHGGGGCACACAGCACACACAGGGRAGCSAKDFYQPNPFAASCRKAADRRKLRMK